MIQFKIFASSIGGCTKIGTKTCGSCLYYFRDQLVEMINLSESHKIIDFDKLSAYFSQGLKIQFVKKQGFMTISPQNCSI